MNQQFPQLNHAMLEEFRDFVDKQEAKLADALLLATVPPLRSKESFHPLHLHGSGHFRLSQALQVMSMRIRDLHEGDATLKEWHAAAGIINQAFWNYIEVLESAVLELFDRVDEVELTRWSEGFAEIVACFKELLAHRIEDLIWVYRRVENLLFDYRSIAEKRRNVWMLFGKLLRRFSYVLDRSLLNHLSQADEVLNKKYKIFHSGFKALKKYLPEIQEKESCFENFPVFPSLADKEKHTLIRLYRLLALHEKNGKNGALNPDLIDVSIKNLAKPGWFASFFRHYLNLIKKKFFHTALLWQEQRNSAFAALFENEEAELDHLKTLVGSYREVALNSEADPYAKIRWPLTQWIVGTEPRKTRDFLYILYDIEAVKKLFSTIYQAIEKGQAEDWLVRRNLLKKQVEEVLHEMGQPLSSRHLIQVKAEHFIELLGIADELGGTLGDMRPLVSEWILKALGYDEKYQTLNDYPSFDELYVIHRGLMPPIQDQEHESRLKLFHSSIHHIEHWLKKKSTLEHKHEMETEESSIQEALQNFLGKARLGFATDEDRILCMEMVLEYRYLFSRFFHFLRKEGSEGKSIRSQFSFVDHYLESVEELFLSREK